MLPKYMDPKNGVGDMEPLYPEVAPKGLDILGD